MAPKRETAISGVSMTVDGLQPASFAIIAARLERGLALRLRRARGLVPEPSGAHATIVAAKDAPTATQETGSTSTNDQRGSRRGERDRGLYIPTALVSPHVRMQAQMVETISPNEQAEFDVVYAVGAAFASREPTPSQLAEASDEEFSVVLESMVRFGLCLGLDEEKRAALLCSIGRFVGEVNGRGAGGGSQVRPDITTRIAAIAAAPDKNGLAQLRRSATQAKRHLLAVLGPDLLSAVQALCDPAQRLSQRQLWAMSSVMHDWGCGATFTSLLQLRLVGPYEAEHAYLRNELGRVAEPPSTLSHSRMLAAILCIGPRTRSVRPAVDDYGRKLAWLFHRVHVAVAGRQAPALIDALVDVHAHDAALIGFLDWTAVHHVLRDGSHRADARSTFVTYLMNDDMVRSLFPRVALATGKGALISDLTSLIEPKRRADAIKALLAQLRTLPDRAAKDLALAILDRSIIERLASALPRPRNWPREFQSDGARVSMVRIEALRAARERHLLTSEAASAAMSQEVDQLRMLYFQGRMRTGRVRVPWDEIERTVRETFGGDVATLRHLRHQRDTGSDLPDLTERLARFLTDRITDHILYESEVNVDQSLSNNLRHGIIVPRFLRAFDDAFQTAAEQTTLPEWDDATLQRNFGKSGSSLIELRDFVSETMKAFVDQRLTVSRNEPFDLGLRQELVDRVLGHAQSGTARARSDRLDRAVGALARRHLKKHLTVARRHLANGTKRAVMAEVRAVRSRSREWPSQTTAAFLDCLETNLHAAFEETRQWIGVTVPRGPAIPFTLAEIVRLHLLSTSFFAWDKLRVGTKCFRQVGSAAPAEADYALAGKYLEMFQEVVHNLLTNAFKHSGEELKTEIGLELAVLDGSLVIRCTNSIAEARVPEVIRNHGATVALARSRQGDHARRDQVSGFQKIRRAFTSALRRQPHINIPPVKAGGRRFLVEITIGHDGGVIA
jgi:hypothetical protein